MRSVRRLVSLTAITVLTACGGGGGGGSTTPPPPPPADNNVTVTGSAEKGPFVAGAQVEARLVAPDGTIGAVQASTSVNDAAGRFGFTAARNTLIQVSVTGQYGSELDGQTSSAAVSLRALVVLPDAATHVVRINVLTHLAADRALTLMQGGATAFAALVQARDFVLLSLEPVSPRPPMDTLESLSIYGVTQGDAWMLMISTLAGKVAENRALRNGTSQAIELQAMLDAWAGDLSDGVFDDTAIIDEMRGAMPLLEPVVVAGHLAQFAQAAGLSAAPADFISFLDSDLDGQINLVDIDDDGDGVVDTADAYPFDSACHLTADGDGLRCRPAIPIQIVHDANGVLYLLQTRADKIYRWSTTESRFLSTILLDRNPPTPYEARSIAVSDALQRLYIGYTDGRITQIDLSAGLPEETILANDLGAVLSLIATPELLIATDGKRIRTLDHEGILLDIWIVAGFNTGATGAITGEFAWDPDSRRLYWIKRPWQKDGCHDGSLIADEIDPVSGAFVSRVEQDHGQAIALVGAITVSPVDGRILSPCGTLFRPDDLAWDSAIPHHHADARWLGDGVLLTIRAEGTSTRLERRDLDGLLVESRLLPGKPVRIVDLGDRTVIVTDAGPLNFFDYTPDDDVDDDGVVNVADAFPDDPAASVDSDWDGFPDAWNAGAGASDSPTGLLLDAYPLDAGCFDPAHGDGVVCDPASTLPAAYLPDLSVVDDNGVVYLLSADNERVYRRDSFTDLPLNPIPTGRHGIDDPGRAVSMAWSSAQARLYIGYDSGAIDYVEPSSLNTRSRLSVASDAASELVAANDFLFVSSGDRETKISQFLVDDAGQVSQAAWPVSPLTDLVWNGPLKRVYGTARTFGNGDVPGFTEIDPSSGQFSNTVAPLDFFAATIEPLRVSVDGLLMTTASGEFYVFASDLVFVGTVVSGLADVQWLSNGTPGDLVGLSDDNGNTQLTRLGLPDTVFESLNYDGSPLALLRAGNDDFIVVTDDGRPGIHRYAVSDDADGDGVDNALDAFPNDPAASVDTDNDGAPDAWNPGAGPGDSTTGLMLDAYPNDAACQTPEQGDGSVCDIAAALPAYAAGSALMDSNGIVYLIGDVPRRVFRYDSNLMAHLNPLVLSPSALASAAGLTQAALAAGSERLYLGLANRAVLYFDLSEPGAEHMLPNAPGNFDALAVVDDAVLIRTQNAFETNPMWHALASNDTWAPQPPWPFLQPGFAHDAANDRIYSQTLHPTMFHRIGVATTGMSIELTLLDSVPCCGSPSSFVIPPYRLSGDGLKLASRSGVIMDTVTLEPLRTMPTGFIDAQWQSDDSIVQIRAVPPADTRLIRYDSQNEVIDSADFSGNPLAVFNVAGGVLVVTNQSPPGFYFRSTD